MDNKKIGNLIRDMRKQMNMTQSQLASKLNISDKAISKWERGLGCPDVSILPALSNALGVNIEKILDGQLDDKSFDGGNMKNIRFYTCTLCSNVITSTSEADVSCCSRKMEALKPIKEFDDIIQSVTEVENDHFITFDHEMTKINYIDFVAYGTYDRLLLVKMYPQQSAEVRIPKMQKGKLYVHSTEHGLLEYRVQSSGVSKLK